MSEVTVNEVLSFPAAVIRTATQDELRALAIEREVIDDAYVQKYKPYFWPAEASSTRLDSHGTRMAVSTLKNYAAEAEAGVSFLYSHDNREIVGRSMGGRFVNAQGNGVARFTADFFAVPGVKLGSVSSDQIIFAIDSKMLRDVSVGFYGGEWMCSICGRDIWGMECRHWPLMKYEVEHDGRTEEVLCTADVENAHLAEVSGVYKGSTPGAAIGKAEREAKDGRLSPEVRRMLETRFQMHLPDKRAVVPGHKEMNVSTNREAEPNPPEQSGSPAPEAPPAQDPPVVAPPPAVGTPSGDETREVAELLTRAGVTSPQAVTPIAALRALTAECERLKPLADDGTKYRERLRERVIQEQVRATGAANESFRSIVSRATVAELEGMLPDLAKQGNDLFAGGRRTVDGTELPDEPETQTRAADIPPAYHGAYSAS
jgi:hypothetical protein